MTDTNDSMDEGTADGGAEAMGQDGGRRRGICRPRRQRQRVAGVQRLGEDWQGDVTANLP